jgi:hypothetical protein
MLPGDEKRVKLKRKRLQECGKFELKITGNTRKDSVELAWCHTVVWRTSERDDVSQPQRHNLKVTRIGWKNNLPILHKNGILSFSLES